MVFDGLSVEKILLGAGTVVLNVCFMEDSEKKDPEGDGGFVLG